MPLVVTIINTTFRVMPARPRTLNIEQTIPLIDIARPIKITFRPGAQSQAPPENYGHWE